MDRIRKVLEREMHNLKAKACGPARGCVYPGGAERYQAASSEKRMKGATIMRTILGRCFGTLVIFAAVSLIAHLNVRAADQPDNKEVSRLLEDIKVQAADLQRSH